MNHWSKISLILLTKNEEENIKKHFGWLKEVPRINEIILIDDNSTDKTVAEVKKLCETTTIKVFQRELCGDFASQRQFAIIQASNDWILWLDADEEPSFWTKKFLRMVHLDKSCQYAFKRHDDFMGRILQHGENRSNRFVRLFNKNNGRFCGKVHEIWKGSGTTLNIDTPIIHYPHPTLESFFHKINFYTDIRANELFDNGIETNLLEIIFYPLGKFIQNYILRLGFLDSTQGIIMALSMSFHSFLVRAKLWHLWSTKS